MSIRILAVGDHFVPVPLIVEMLHAEPPDNVEFREITLPWPIVPFGPVAEVEEACGLHMS